jgi:hypothetical protein
MRRPGLITGVLLLIVGVTYLGANAANGSLGHAPTGDELGRWDAAVLPDGTGLPHGTGTAKEGEPIYRARCASCHGAHGDGTDELGPQLVGGVGTLASKKPVLTVGSYWPYSTSVWDYIHRAMPYPKPGSRTADETYGLTAYLLYLNGIVKGEQALNEHTLPAVHMPNRNGFVPDPRPDVRGTTSPK